MYDGNISRPCFPISGKTISIIITPKITIVIKAIIEKIKDNKDFLQKQKQQR